MMVYILLVLLGIKAEMEWWYYALIIMSILAVIGLHVYEHTQEARLKKKIKLAIDDFTDGLMEAMKDESTSEEEDGKSDKQADGDGDI